MAFHLHVITRTNMQKIYSIREKHDHTKQLRVLRDDKT